MSNKISTSSIQKVKNLQGNFKAVREQLRMSQAEFGALLGVDGNYIYQIESGKKQVSDHKPLGVLFSLLQKSPQAVVRLIRATEIHEESVASESGEYGIRSLIMPEGAFDALSQFVSFSMADCTPGQITDALQWILHSQIREPYKNAVAGELTRLLQKRLKESRP